MWICSNLGANPVIYWVYEWLGRGFCRIHRLCLNDVTFFRSYILTSCWKKYPGRSNVWCRSVRMCCKASFVNQPCFTACSRFTFRTTPFNDHKFVVQHQTGLSMYRAAIFPCHFTAPSFVWTQAVTMVIRLNVVTEGLLLSHPPNYDWYQTQWTFCVACGCGLVTEPAVVVSGQ